MLDRALGGASLLMAAGADLVGLDMAAEFHTHYLAGQGMPKILEPTRARKLPFIAAGEQLNLKRFKEDALNPKKKLGAAFADALQSGSAKLDEDEYRVDFKQEADQQEKRPGLDAHWATGHSKLRSTLRGEVHRVDGGMIFEGVVEHTWGDVYDFNSDTPQNRRKFAIQHRLNKVGIAHDFKYGAAWDQKIRIFVPVIAGKMGEPEGEASITSPVSYSATLKRINRILPR